MGNTEQAFTGPLSLGPQNFVDVSASLLRKGYSVRFRVPGRSMRPTILDGETITVQPVAPPDIKQGDIILYRFQDGVVVHRVVGIGRKKGDALFFILRGDALGTPDEPVVSQRVLGKVVSVERGGRHVDPYSLWARIYRRVRRCASRLKGYILMRSLSNRHGIDHTY